MKTQDGTWPAYNGRGFLSYNEVCLAVYLAAQEDLLSLSIPAETL